MFNEFSKNYTGEIKIKESFSEKQTDFRSLLLRIKKSDIKNIWLVSHLKNSGLIYKQAKELGLKLNFFSDVYSIEGKDFLISANDKNINDIFYLSPNFDENINSTAKEFAKNYKKIYQDKPNYFAAQSFDAVLAIGLASLNCEKLTTDCIEKNLYKISFNGASGKIQFNKFGDVKKNLILKKVKNSEFLIY